MRHIPLALALFVAAAAIAFAQPDRRASGEPAPQEAIEARPFFVTFSEFRLTDSADPALSSADIVEAFQRMRQEGTLELVQTVRMTGMEREESEVLFGKSVPITTGETAGGKGVGATSVDWEEVGTFVTMQGTSQADGMLLRFRYESSGFDEGDAADPLTDRQARLRVSTAALLAPGKPALVGGTSADGSRYLLVMLED
jgi:hypothetical protein